jgi:phosphoadenosine phosphosulfate reductase
VVLNDLAVDALAVELDRQHPSDILAFALREYGTEMALSFSGAEDVALIDMAARSDVPFRVFTLDTGRLHSQTYAFFDTVRSRYGVAIETFTPQPDALQELVTKKGYFSFYTDGHQECCGIRKVEPLRRALAGLRAYATGQRRDQSPATRTFLPVVQVDTAFSTPERELVKFNPLANWTSGDVWQYIRENDVPYNPLHDMGFRSIGCEPCTRATNPGEHERAGRWWWEEATQRECGLHVINHVDGNGAH